MCASIMRRKTVFFAFFYACKERLDLKMKRKRLISYNKRLLYRLWTIFFIKMERD